MTVRRGGSWHAGDRARAEAAACRWEYRPERLHIQINDTRTQTLLDRAAEALGYNGEVERFLLFCAFRLIRRSPALREVRARMRADDKERRQEKRLKAAQQKAFEAKWKEDHK